MPKDRNIVQPIDASLDDVASALVPPAIPFRRNIKGLSVKNPSAPAGGHQGVLDLGVEVQRDIDGVEMGVLDREDQPPYSSARTESLGSDPLLLSENLADSRLRKCFGGFHSACNE